MSGPSPESGRFRGVTPLSWPALEDGNPDTSVGRYSPTLRRAPEFVSAGEDVLPAGSIPSVVSSPSVAHDLIDCRLDETGSDLFPIAIAFPIIGHEFPVPLDVGM